MAVGEHADGAVQAPAADGLEEDVALPAGAAHDALDVDGRSVGVCGDGRGRVAGDAQGERREDVHLFEVGVVILAVLLHCGIVNKSDERAISRRLEGDVHDGLYVCDEVCQCDRIGVC